MDSVPLPGAGAVRGDAGFGEGPGAGVSSGIIFGVTSVLKFHVCRFAFPVGTVIKNGWMRGYLWEVSAGLQSLTR
ncbi:hypothetical protein HMPREF1631_01460 [Arcanobacterium sp. S3PF19]|nr:hypothetical protein HMPREF1631_01460 [Arcanobacterium sp. S3PF19]